MCGHSIPILALPLMSNTVTVLSTQSISTPTDCREGELDSLTIHLPWAQSKYAKRNLSINPRRTKGKWSASKVGGDIDSVDQYVWLRRRTADEAKRNLREANSSTSRLWLSTQLWRSWWHTVYFFAWCFWVVVDIPENWHRTKSMSSINIVPTT